MAEQHTRRHPAASNSFLTTSHQQTRFSANTSRTWKSVGKTAGFGTKTEVRAGLKKEGEDWGVAKDRNAVFS